MEKSGEFVKKIVIYEDYEFYKCDDGDVVFELKSPEILVDVFYVSEKLDALIFTGINEQGFDVSLKIEDFDDDCFIEVIENGFIRVVLYNSDGSVCYFDDIVELK